MENQVADSDRKKDDQKTDPISPRKGNYDALKKPSLANNYGGNYKFYRGKSRSVAPSANFARNVYTCINNCSCLNCLNIRHSTFPRRCQNFSNFQGRYTTPKPSKEPFEGFREGKKDFNYGFNKSKRKRLNSEQNHVQELESIKTNQYRVSNIHSNYQNRFSHPNPYILPINQITHNRPMNRYQYYNQFLHNNFGSNYYSKFNLGLDQQTNFHNFSNKNSPHFSNHLQKERNSNYLKTTGKIENTAEFLLKNSKDFLLPIKRDLTLRQPQQNNNPRYALRNRLNIANRQIIQKKTQMSGKGLNLLKTNSRYHGNSHANNINNRKRKCQLTGPPYKKMTRNNNLRNFTPKLQSKGGNNNVRRKVLPQQKHKNNLITPIKDIKYGQDTIILRKEIAHAPKNDNEFLMQDHYTNAHGVIYTPSNYVLPIPSASTTSFAPDTSSPSYNQLSTVTTSASSSALPVASRTDMVRDNSRSSVESHAPDLLHHTEDAFHHQPNFLVHTTLNDNNNYEDDEDYVEELFLEKEFAEEYDSVRNQRLNSMTKAQLIQEILFLENQLEEREKELMIMKMAEATSYHAKSCPAVSPNTNHLSSSVDFLLEDSEVTEDLSS